MYALLDFAHAEICDLAKAHPFLPNSVDHVKREMLDEIGFSSIEALFADIPEPVRLRKGMALPKARSELEVRRHIENILQANVSTSDVLSFLGGGVWPHYVPAPVDQLVNRGEFLTSYTPYQAEISQGMLQAMFEYQSMICELTDMEFANSSLYDWSTALGEAARMCARVTGRDEFLVPHFIHPERLSTLKTFCEPAEIRIREIEQDRSTGQVNTDSLQRILSDRTAGVYLENPSYLGFVETEAEIVGDLCRRTGALFVMGVDPIALGVFKSPGAVGADIAVGEGQPLGNHMNYGGPLLGILACKGDRLLRQMPGRIIGMTTTKDGAQRAFCMALQTREQHIRREKATSNICTNEALCAVAAAVYLSLLGPQGLHDLCVTILARSRYAMRRLAEIGGVRAPVFDSPHFKEFTVNFDRSGKRVREILARLLQSRIQGGIPLDRQFPELGETMLVCVTELHSEHDVERLASALEQILEG